MAYHENIGEWHGKDLVDRNGEKIGKLEDVYVDVETDEPMFGTVKEGLIGRHLTFVPLAGITIGPDSLRVPVSRDAVKSALARRLRVLGRDRASVSSRAGSAGAAGTPCATQRRAGIRWSGSATSCACASSPTRRTSRFHARRSALRARRASRPELLGGG